MSEYEALGKRVRLIEGRDKVTGLAKYVADLYVPRMLHARLVSSLYAHANINQISTEEALRVPGVVTVITSDDLPDIVPSSRNKLLLARDKVIFAGQPVALVLAESESAAEDGVDRVTVDYEPLQPIVTVEQAMDRSLPRIWPAGVPSGADDAAAHGADVGGDEHDDSVSNMVSSSVVERGDIKNAFDTCDVIVERNFSSPMVHQSSLETHGVLVQSDPVSGGATVWACTQDPFGVRQSVAEVLKVAETDVRVIVTTVGGAFGAKFGLYEPLIALVARKVGRPVRLALTRSEELLATTPAPPIQIKGKLGATSDGKLVALQAEVLLDSGCYPMNLAGFVGHMLGSFYPMPNFEIKTIEVMTNKPSTGAYRAPGAPTVVFAIDSLIDEAANQLGLDSIEVRLANLAKPGDPMSNNRPWAGMGMREALEALHDHPVWRQRQVANANGHGVGVAVGGWFGGVEPASAICGLNRDGLIHIHVGSSDITGTATGFSVLAAEAFGVSLDKVRVIINDTQTAPFAGGAGGSKITYSVWSSVIKAAQEARKQVLAIAAEEFEAAQEDLEIVDGQVRVRGVPGKAISLSKIASKTMEFGGKYPPVYAHGSTAITKQSPGFSAQLAEVSVDGDTGEIRIHKLIIVQDVGRAINPLAIEGQMMGGATQGIGWGLHEAMTYDDQGQLTTGSWMDYDIPDFTQSAENYETIIVEVPSEHGPFGARGVGEPPVIPTAAAIANAVADATGFRASKIPITALDVWQGLNH